MPVSRRRKVQAVGVTLMIVFAVVMTILELRATAPRVRAPVEAGEAKALLDRTVELALAGQFDSICQDIAETPISCQTDLKNTLNIGWRPGPDKPELVGYTQRDRQDPMLILQVEGVRQDGTSYDADFGVSRTYSGQVVVRYPIYWSGVGLSPPGTSQPCPDICVQPPVAVPTR